MYSDLCKVRKMWSKRLVKWKVRKLELKDWLKMKV